MSEKKKGSKEGSAEEVARLTGRISDLENKWKRAVADYRNLERRVAKERAEFVQLANSVLISELLPILDDLYEAAEKSEDEGYGKILRKFQKVLGDAGLEEVEVRGREFDPGCMEAVEGSKGGEEAKVVEVVRKGYTLNGRLLRPARVKVG